MRLGVQQHIDVLSWILVENHEARAGAQGQLPEEKPTARVHSEVARLDDQFIFRNDGQPAVNDQQVDCCVL